MKYHFVASFADEFMIWQGDDVSVINSEKSKYYDVLQEIEKGNTLTYFILYNDVDDVEMAINLKSLAIIADGCELYLHDPDVKYTDVKLVFFRRHTVTFNSGEEDSHTIRYILGWEGKNPQGERKEFTIQFD